MAKKKSDKNIVKNETTGNSGLPLVIIGIVLLVAVVGGWYLYQSSSKKTPVANSNTRANTTNQQQPNDATLTSSVVGAQPPHFKGAQNAPVILEEFADYQCPTCAKMHPLMNEINSIYGSRIKFIFRNYPIVQIHKNAYEAAVAAEAAGLQGRFWEMQNLIFQNQSNWSNVSEVRPVFEGYAQTLGLNMDQFKADVAGIRAKERVGADLKRAQSLGISSTPTLLINSRPIPFEQMTLDDIRQIIDAELAKTNSSQQPTSAPVNKSDEEKGIEKAPAGNTANSNTKK